MSRVFQKAYSLGDYNPLRAIELYNIEIDVNPENFPAWQNRELCKLKLAIENKDLGLLDESKVDFKKAIELATTFGTQGFQIAEDNLKWAEETRF